MMKRITVWRSKLRRSFTEGKVYLIKPKKGPLNIGAGFGYRGEKYITHTNLSHKQSALVTFMPWQKRLLASMAAVILGGLLVETTVTLIILVAILSLLYLIDLVFSLYVLVKSLRRPPEIVVNLKEIEGIDEKKLPVYTILCPLYKETAVLAQFIKNIEKIDWPKKKLEALLLLEENDEETIRAAEKIDLPKHIKVVVVPQSKPKTKPKACNYGLSLAKGEYVVIYDAEDEPDPLQLKKAYLAFRKVGKRVFCLQSKLNYYNTDFNLLTRLFTAEYSLWFDVILPGLQSIEAIIPLGGTSNHFRTEDLRKLCGWDPFNVTEDCDLGVRLFKAGYKTAIIDSTTLEEANSKVGNWLRQRSRWIKGYLQTYFVHMREPIGLMRNHGIDGLIFQLVIGMRMTFMLINPLLWVATIAYFTLYRTVGQHIDAIYPTAIFYIAVVSLVLGNFVYLYNYMIGCAKREQWGLMKYVFLVPFYWLLMSWAAGMAVYQLIRKPHYWEKTQHGLGRLKKRSGGWRISWVGVSDLGQRGAWGGFFLVGATAGSNLINFLYNAYLGRVLSLEEFGLVTVMSSFFFFSVLVTNALGSTVTHKTAYLYGKMNRPVKEYWHLVRGKTAVVSMLMAIIWIVTIPFWSGFFNESRALPFILFTPVWFFSLLLAVDRGFLRGSMKFFAVGVLLLVEAVTKMVITVGLVGLGLNEWVYAAIPMATLVCFVMTWVAVAMIKNKPLAEGTSESEQNFPKAFFVDSVMIGLSMATFMGLDMVLVKHYLTATAAGGYALLSLGGKIVFFSGMVFGQFINPLVSKEEGRRGDAEGVFYKLFGVIALGTLASYVVVGLMGQKIMPVLFGDQMAEVSPYLPIFTLGIVCFTLATGVVSYHQVKRHSAFAVLGLGAAVAEFVVLSFWHSNLLMISEVILCLGFFYLLIVLLTHFSYGMIGVAADNVKDFLGLFSKEPLAPLPNGGLRILMLNWRDTKHMWAGGAEVYVHELAKRWVKDGNKITLFCGNDGKSKRNEVVDGVRIVRRGGFYTVYLWAALYYVIRFRGVFDVVVESENGVAFFTPLYVRKPKFLIVHHVHQEVFRTYLRFPLSLVARAVESGLMPYVYRNQKVVTVSESSKKGLVKLGFTKEDDIEIVTPAVDVNGYGRVAKTSYPSFVYMGRLKPYKNIEVAIEAFGEVHGRCPNARLVIAGDGESREFLEGMVKEMGLTKAVTFLGRVSERVKRRILAQSWMALQPSSFEGWGITVIESNACGTPVIASKVNGLKDSVVDGRTGVLVPVRDAQRLAKVMTGLIENKKYLNYLSKCAREWARQFSWDKAAESFMKVIHRKVEESRKMMFTKEMVAAKETI